LALANGENEEEMYALKILQVLSGALSMSFAMLYRYFYCVWTLQRYNKSQQLQQTNISEVLLTNYMLADIYPQ